MKKILKIALAASMALLATDAFAQLSVGVGYGLSSVNTKSKTLKEFKEGANMSGFYAGIGYNLPIVAGFGVEPGVYYVFANSTKPIISLGSIADLKTKSQEHYIDIPVKFNYGFELGGNLRVFAYAGPTFSFGLISRVSTYATTASGNTEKNVTQLYGKSKDYSQFDVLMGIGGGVDVAKNIRLTLGYDFGLLDRNKTDDLKRHRNFLHVGVAYLF